MIDTNVVILLKHLDATELPDEPLVSAVTIAELSAGPHLTDDPHERAARQAHLQQAEADFESIPFDTQAARAFGRVAADLRRAGRKSTAQALDALIAATAVAHGLPVYTTNAADFTGIENLDVRTVARPRTDLPDG
ncbi:type II toxin-antitoxin system VapC family toxin [Cellulosimicrobium protaetiae]|uniref:Ribonuclease VapC n=1 Tax=Cellulosimicrobium protaetiae TaxID=2587808 RepID=A0A6M5UHU5_9MICO|nr:type II toxin-antitoxin system VapC family toxin [Cellulosimicrobium protaetiae]